MSMTKCLNLTKYLPPMTSNSVFSLMKSLAISNIPASLLVENPQGGSAVAIYLRRCRNVGGEKDPQATKTYSKSYKRYSVMFQELSWPSQSSIIAVDSNKACRQERRHTHQRRPCPISHLIAKFAMWEDIVV